MEPTGRMTKVLQEKNRMERGMGMIRAVNMNVAEKTYIMVMSSFERRRRSAMAGQNRRPSREAAQVPASR